MVLLIKPSKASIKKAKETIKGVFQQYRGRPIGEIITKLNPIVKGIGNYWSSVIAKDIYSSMDRYVWLKTMKYFRVLHPKKSWRWRFKQYFKADYTGVSKDKWILTDPKDNRNQLMKMNWIPIVRHPLIKFKNSPDDPSLKEYFDKRDETEFIKNNVMSRRKIAKRSNYKCRVCNQSLVGEESLKVNLIVPNLLGGKEKYDNLEILHTSCYMQHNHLLKKHGEGKELPKVQKFFREKDIAPSSKEGIALMKLQFKKFKYANCKGK